MGKRQKRGQGCQIQTGSAASGIIASGRHRFDWVMRQPSADEPSRPDHAVVIGRHDAIDGISLGELDDGACGFLGRQEVEDEWPAGLTAASA
jgi:hypothetical protein